MTARELATAVRDAVEHAERDLDRMPFFIRPLKRGKFKDRTGMSYDAWRERLRSACAASRRRRSSVPKRWTRCWPG